MFWSFLYPQLKRSIVKIHKIFKIHKIDRNDDLRYFDGYEVLINIRLNVV